MSVRQRWTLVRILAGAALLVAACLIPVQDRWLRLALFAVPYLVAGGGRAQGRGAPHLPRAGVR